MRIKQIKLTAPYTGLSDLSRLDMEFLTEQSDQYDLMLMSLFELANKHTPYKYRIDRQLVERLMEYELAISQKEL